MKMGAWISAATGHYQWITFDHAQWIQVPGQAEDMGIPDDAAEHLRQIRWDFNGPGRRTILLSAMAHGLIRARGHGSSITFEFTVAVRVAIHGAMAFLTDVAGPYSFCSFTNLNTLEAVGFYRKDLPVSQT